MLELVAGLPGGLVDLPVTLEDVFAAREVLGHHLPVALGDIHAEQPRVLFFGQPEPRLVHSLNRFGQDLAGDVQVRQHQHPRSGVPVPQGGLVLRQRPEQPRRLRAGKGGLAEREQAVRVNPPAESAEDRFRRARTPP